jgi:hypothetical protein
MYAWRGIQLPLWAVGRRPLPTALCFYATANLDRGGSSFDGDGDLVLRPVGRRTSTVVGCKEPGSAGCQAPEVQADLAVQQSRRSKPRLWRSALWREPYFQREAMVMSTISAQIAIAECSMIVPKNSIEAQCCECRSATFSDGLFFLRRCYRPTGTIVGRAKLTLCGGCGS